MINNLVKLLLDQKFPPLVIINSAETSIERFDEVNHWISTLLDHYISQFKSISIEQAQELIISGHPDLVKIAPSKDATKYKIENNDLGAFFDSQKFKKWELPTRVIIIESAHLISDQYFNKMLKTLEEPQENTVTILLNHLNKKLLQTIESRAIFLKAPLLDNNTKGQFGQPADALNELSDYKLDDIINNETGYAEFIEKLKKNKDLKERFLSTIINLQSKTNTSYEDHQKTLEEIKWFQKSNLYHNNEQERLFSLTRETLRKYRQNFLNKAE